uniref:Redoxin domain protein n=1 Tax=Solibacter usitatus (strain Ellin6076) TaxID=234267 RepID=Q028V9_SOLUE
MRSPLGIGFVWIAIQLYAAAPDNVEQATARFERSLAKVPEPLRSGFRALAEKALQRHRPLLAQTFSEQPAPAKPAGPRVDPASTPAGAAITRKLDQLTHIPNDADRAKFAIGLASDIRALPAGFGKVLLAWNLRVETTYEGDLGQDALVAVAGTYADALKGCPSADMYVDFAGLVRYEHVRATVEDSALDAALALLELRERIHEEGDFSLAALDGKGYSLSGLRGKVVLLNFWATSCAPCRKEMQDMEKLYREFSGKGLVVLAVSDDKRETIDKFVANKRYTFPILLDPERKAYGDFDIEGIPKTFVFDREGALAAQAIDMRTEAQFRSMLKAAGLE